MDRDWNPKAPILPVVTKFWDVEITEHKTGSKYAFGIETFDAHTPEQAVLNLAKYFLDND